MPRPGGIHGEGERPAGPRRLPIARGFTFGFDGPGTTAGPDAPPAAPPRGEAAEFGFAAGGKSPALVAPRCGDRTAWTPEVRDARFPEPDRVVPAGDGRAAVALSAADAAFLSDRLPDRPGGAAVPDAPPPCRPAPPSAARSLGRRAGPGRRRPTSANSRNGTGPSPARRSA